MLFVDNLLLLKNHKNVENLISNLWLQSLKDRLLEFGNMDYDQNVKFLSKSAKKHQSFKINEKNDYFLVFGKILLDKSKICEAPSKILSVENEIKTVIFLKKFSLNNLKKDLAILIEILK